MALELIVSDYRSKIKAHMRDREFHELDQLLNHLTMKLGDSRHDNELTSQLRLDVIHGQICLASYHEWRQNQKMKQINEASNFFTDALKKDEKASNVTNMLKNLPDR